MSLSDQKDDLCPLFSPGGKTGKTSLSLTVIIILINCIFLMTTSISNLFFVVAIIKRSTLRSSSNIFLASQAGSSVVVFLLAHPSLIALQIEEVLNNDNGYCTAQLFNVATSIMCILTSFSSVLGMAINLFLSLHFPAWYATTVSSKTATTVIILTWFLIAFMTALCVTMGSARLCFFMAILAAAAIMFLILVFNAKSYLKIRKYIMQVQQQLEAPTEVPGIYTPDISRHQKTAALVFCILTTSLLTYIPLFSTLITAYITAWTTVTKSSFIITLTVAYSSCSINAAIYFRRNEEVRFAVLQLIDY